MNRYSITYKFDDGSAVEIPLVDVQRRRIEQLQALAHLGDSEPLRRELATLAGAVVEQEQTAQKRIADGAAISAALRKKKRTALQDAVNEALKALGDTATNAEIRLWCLRHRKHKKHVTPNIDSWKIGRVRAALPKKNTPQT